MSTILSLLVALALSASLFNHPVDWVAWLASVAWASALYGAHEALTAKHNAKVASAAVCAMGAILAAFIGLAVDNSLAGAMAAVCVATALWLRDILARFFSHAQPIEP